MSQGPRLYQDRKGDTRLAAVGSRNELFPTVCEQVDVRGC